MFISKSGRIFSSGPRDFRLNSLASFPIKTLERMVDGYVGDETLALVPLRPNQHAYQAGKSVETALHHSVVRGEKAFDWQL